MVKIEDLKAGIVLGERFRFTHSIFLLESISEKEYKFIEYNLSSKKIEYTYNYIDCGLQEFLANKVLVNRNPLDKSLFDRLNKINRESDIILKFLQALSKGD